MNDYIPTIGIECHVQLKTKTKLFSGVDNDAREAPANTLVSPLCFGLPGTLPVLNGAALDLAIRAGLALKATIANHSKFDRKHYFYPDLPKGYQITQYDEPIILEGRVDAIMPDGSIKTVRVERAHLEEDAGKSTHPAGEDYSLVDLNRAGTPLLEIVSYPDIHSAIEAKAYARELYLLMRYADVSDANLYYGNMRFDVNVSVSNDPNKLGTRSETKNLNSFRAVYGAVEYEIKRQIALLEKGDEVIQETRGWDEDGQKTFSQRSKEDAHDYRYFPEPDIPPIEIAQDRIDQIKETLPAMPGEIREAMIECGVDKMSVEALLDYPELARRWSELSKAESSSSTLKRCADWFANEVLADISKWDSEKISKILETPSALNLISLRKLSKMVDDGLISATNAKSIVISHWTDLYDPEKIAIEHNLMQVSDESELVMIVESVIAENQKAADDVRNGEMKAIGFLVGQVMKASGGKANPGVVTELLKKVLNK